MTFTLRLLLLAFWLAFFLSWSIMVVSCLRSKVEIAPEAPLLEATATLEATANLEPRLLSDDTETGGDTVNTTTTGSGWVFNITTAAGGGVAMAVYPVLYALRRRRRDWATIDRLLGVAGAYGDYRRSVGLVGGFGTGHEDAIEREIQRHLARREIRNAKAKTGRVDVQKVEEETAS